MNILVTGGAGYIGSHVVRVLEEYHHTPIILDDFSTGFRQFVGQRKLYEGSITDKALLDAIFKKHEIEVVMHFAAKAEVEESARHPRKYYETNVLGSLTLLNAMLDHNVKKIVFSSSAAVYGTPKSKRITENHRKAPINVYGRTKLMFEEILEDYRSAYGVGFVALRYFNAAGAMEDASIGEAHLPETHLIPAILNSLLAGKSFNIFGTDYPTPDGTCVRDFVHVLDIASAHVLAMEYLNEAQGKIYNIGNGKGFSVKQVIDVVEEVAGKHVQSEQAPPRQGDPPFLVADAKKIEKELGWKPRFASLESIIATSWNWAKKHFSSTTQ